MARLRLEIQSSRRPPRCRLVRYGESSWGCARARSSGQAEKLSNEAVRSIQHLRKKRPGLGRRRLPALRGGKRLRSCFARPAPPNCPRCPNLAPVARFPVPRRRSAGAASTVLRTSTQRSHCGATNFRATGSCRRSSIARGSRLPDSSRVSLASRPLPEVDLIVPMPLHPKRLAERGFNQALEIARGVARHLGMTIEPRGVLRVKDTAPQTELPYEERAKNVRGAFLCKLDLSGASVARGGRRHDHRRDLERARAGAQARRRDESREPRDRAHGSALNEALPLVLSRIARKQLLHGLPRATPRETAPRKPPG